MYLTHTWDLTGTNALGQGRPGSNGNKGELYTPQTYRTKASLSNAV